MITKANFKLLPAELLIDIIKATNASYIFENKIKILEVKEWSNYAIKMMTCSSIIYKFAEEIFRKVKMSSEKTTCFYCKKDYSNKNISNHLQSKHNSSTTQAMKNDLLQQLKTLTRINEDDVLKIIRHVNSVIDDLSNRLVDGTTSKNYVLEAIDDQHKLAELSWYANDYCHTIGNVALWNGLKDCNDIAVTPPIALLPSPFHDELFKKAKVAQQTLNELYFRVSLDHDFIIDAYRDVVFSDKWIAKQIELMEMVKADGIRQPICVQLQRADYMSHWDERERKMEMKNVKVNIGHVGGPGCATLMTKLHKKMMKKVEDLRYGAFNVNGKMPKNRPRKGMAEVMLHAWKLFGDNNAVVVFLNQPDLFPVCHYEQLQFIQFELEKLAHKEGFHINVIRMSIKETTQRLCLNENDYTMYADGKRVALIHMAYGYLPEHYPSDKEWKIRFDMERSKTILSPNIRLALSGTNKIQQILAKPGIIERFLPDQKENISFLRSTFTGLWGLEEDDDNIRAIIQDVIQYPQKYVMKPAGKGNYFDEQMVDKLSKMTVKERGAYILQQKISPFVIKNYIKRPFKNPTLENIVSEVGMYGSFIGNEKNGEILWNRVEGYLVRSKAHHVNQGGVSDDGCVFDSLILFPENELK